MEPSIEMFEELKETLVDIWNDIKDTAITISEIIRETNHKKHELATFGDVWVIPFNTRKKSQVLNRKPKMHNIRSSL